MRARAELLDDDVRTHAEAVLRRQLLDPAAGGLDVEPAAAGRLRAQHDVLEDGQVVGQHEVLVHHADAGGDGVGRALEAHRCAVDGHRPVVGPLHAVDDLHERRLAGAVLPDDGVDLALAHDERDVAVGDDAGEALGDARELDDDIGGDAGRCCGRRGHVASRPDGGTVRRMTGRRTARGAVPVGTAPRTGRTHYGVVGTSISPSMICCFSSSSCSVMSSSWPPEVA